VVARLVERAPDRVDTTVLDTILGRELIPVLAPVAAADGGGSFNVNADTFAGAIAGALKAKALFAFDRRTGRARQVEEPDRRIVGRRRAQADRRRHHLGRHDPQGRDLPLRAGAGRRGVVILDGKVPHAVLLELFTDHGAGTLIHR